MSNAYHLLGLAYKFLLTLSITQVACECTFSTLKFIKTRLKSVAHQIRSAARRLGQLEVSLTRRAHSIRASSISNQVLSCKMGEF